jgi:hypothetical protein
MWSPQLHRSAPVWHGRRRGDVISGWQILAWAFMAAVMLFRIALLLGVVAVVALIVRGMRTAERGHCLGTAERVHGVRATEPVPDAD